MLDWGQSRLSIVMIFVYLCICVFVYLCICVFVYLCICVFVYLCICVFVCACVSLSLSLSLSVCLCLCVCLKKHDKLSWLQKELLTQTLDNFVCTFSWVSVHSCHKNRDASISHIHVFLWLQKIWKNWKSLVIFKRVTVCQLQFDTISAECTVIPPQRKLVYKFTMMTVKLTLSN